MLQKFVREREIEREKAGKHRLLLLRPLHAQIAVLRSSSRERHGKDVRAWQQAWQQGRDSAGRPFLFSQKAMVVGVLSWREKAAEDISHACFLSHPMPATVPVSTATHGMHGGGVV